MLRDKEREKQGCRGQVRDAELVAGQVARRGGSALSFESAAARRFRADSAASRVRPRRSRSAGIRPGIRRRKSAAFQASWPVVNRATASFGALNTSQKRATRASTPTSVSIQSTHPLAASACREPRGTSPGSPDLWPNHSTMRAVPATTNPSSTRTGTCICPLSF